MRDKGHDSFGKNASPSLTPVRVYYMYKHTENIIKTINQTQSKGIVLVKFNVKFLL